MATKNQATAGSASPTSAEAKQAEKDKKVASEQSKKLNKKGAVRKAGDEADEPEKIDPLPLEEISRRARLADDRTRSPRSANPDGKFDLTVSVTREEAAEVNKLLSKLREEARVREGNPSPKAFLVNDSGSDRVRWGGVTYTVPEGRNELTDEFIEKNFPDGITRDDLVTGRLLGGRIKVEQEAVEAKGAEKAKSAKAPKAKASKARPSRAKATKARATKAKK